MATTTCITNTFRTGLFAGSYDLPNDVIKCALYNHTSGGHNQNTTVYATTNEASGTGYTAAGKTMTSYAAAIDTTNHVAYLDWADVSWTTATVTATDCMVYDDTISDHAMYLGDFSGSKSSSAGTFTVVLPVAAYNTALIRLA